MNTNNFHLYFPEGFYRRKELLNEKKEQIIRDIDYLLRLINFDLDSFKEERNLWHSKLEESLDLLKKGYEEKAIEIGTDAEKHLNKLEEMIEPVYYNLIKKGYSPIELIT